MFVLNFFVVVFPRRTTRWLRNTAATGPQTVVAPHHEMIPVEEILWSQRFSERMKTSSQSPVPGSTALHRGESAASFSPLWETSFLFFAPVTRLTRTCVNTLLWSNSVFLHQSSSFLTEVEVFDIKSCMQKAHCEWITVPVINSFTSYFLCFWY